MHLYDADDGLRTAEWWMIALVALRRTTLPCCSPIDLHSINATSVEKDRDRVTYLCCQKLLWLTIAQRSALLLFTSAKAR